MMIFGDKRTKMMPTLTKRFAILFECIVISLHSCANLESNQPGVLLPYQTLYVSGVEAYMSERWTECVTLVSKAIIDHRSFVTALNTCRQGCKSAGNLRIDESNFLDTVYLESAQKQSACIRNCTDNAFPNRLPYKDLSPKLKEVEAHFQNSDPYDYLQMCAFKAQQFELAFSAAYTFSMLRPNHPHAGRNLQFYMTLTNDNKEMFKNLELKRHQQLRREAVEAYDQGLWTEAVTRFESSVSAYLEADEECEAGCDSLLDEPKFSEFYKKVVEAKFKEEVRYYLTNHWLKLLNCKESCTKKLATIDGVSIDRFFLDHFHYLQYCYYKAGDPIMAARNVATYLLFNPNDPNQLYNKIFYLQQSSVYEEHFVSRQDAQILYERKTLDARMKKLADEEFVLHRGKRNLKSYTVNSPEVYNHPTNDSILSFHYFLQSIGTTLTLDSSMLGGRRRVVADGLVGPQDARWLIELANTCHNENMNKVAVSKAAEMVRDGKAKSHQVSSLMQVSDKARLFLERYHDLKVPLLFQRTQLTFREAETSTNPVTLTLSELDACSTDQNIFCTGSKARDFVAYIYLDNKENENNKDTFHFLDEKDQTSAVIEPRQGRMVGLTINDTHHLERITTGGSRSAIIIWFTLSPADQELDHAEARTVLRIVQGRTMRTSKISLASLDFMKSKHYSLSFDEDDLNGPERFAVDGIASEEECRALIRLTNKVGYMGDGYEGRDPMFPHTKHEVFEGINVLDAAELAQQHKVPAEDVQLYLRLSNDMKELTREVLVGGDRRLYFSFTHLVCRTALNDENLDRTDLSHPIHSDNCIIQEDNTCKKVRPAYIERDYSAILYLNDDFFGGDFFFAHQNMSVQSRVKPKCGRVVSFNSGHYHGVKPVLSGQRCAVAIWFTLDPDYDEMSHPMAQEILEDLRRDGHNGEGDHFHMEL